MFEKNENIERKMLKPAELNILKNNSIMLRFTVLSFVFILLIAGCSSEKQGILLDRSASKYDGGYRALSLSKGDKSPVLPALPARTQNLELKAGLEVQKPELDTAQQERLVVYNAVVSVVVERISDSISCIQKTVEKMGGYMQEMTSNSITLKVPANKFQDAIAQVEKLGEVIKRDIKGADVTEEMRDLNIRLQNAEQARDKMKSLLEKSNTVEDTLKVEKELERITETIELLKGKIIYLRNKVDYSILTVQFNSPVPQENFTAFIPFYWVQVLGSELTKPINMATTRESFLSGIFNHAKFDLPDGYIKYFDNKQSTRAMSADGMMIYVHKEKNYNGGNLEFWSSLVKRMLVERRTISIKKQTEIKLKNKKDAVLFVGSREFGSKQYGYLAAIVPTKDNVYIFEAWGPGQEFEKDQSKLENAVLSMTLN
jgi:hypothetical protein